MKPRFRLLRIISLLSFIIILLSCGEKEKPKKLKQWTKKQLDSIMVDMETKYNRLEEERIKDYISRHIPMEKSPMGFWYSITKKNPSGKEIKDLDLVKYSRVVSLCNARELYRDEVILKISNGNEIPGIHDALKMLHQGENALFIFPSYLAHGLLGDMNKVPPKSELIYEVTILDVQ